MTDSTLNRGPIAWMARNAVAANLLMLMLMVGGLLTLPRIQQEVFPSLDLDVVTVSVVYPGATPEEIEKSIARAVEESITGLDGVKRVTSVSREGSVTVSAELLLGANANLALQDIRNAVDRLTTLPEEAERPLVSLLQRSRAVISLLLYGEVGERTLGELADRARDELTQDPDITLVEIEGTRPLEIGIEVPREALRAHGLTLARVAEEVGRATVDLAGGGVKTGSGEILLRTDERRDFGSEFRDLPILSAADGTTVPLGRHRAHPRRLLRHGPRHVLQRPPRREAHRLPGRQRDPAQGVPGRAGLRRAAPRAPSRGRGRGHRRGPFRGVRRPPAAPAAERGLRPRTGHARARPLPRGAPRLLGHAGHPDLVPRVPHPAPLPRRLHQHDLALRVHRVAGHRRRRRHRRRREHLPPAPAGMRLRGGGRPGHPPDHACPWCSRS